MLVAMGVSPRLPFHPPLLFPVPQPLDDEEYHRPHAEVTKRHRRARWGCLARL